MLGQWGFVQVGQPGGGRPFTPFEVRRLGVRCRPLLAEAGACRPAVVGKARATPWGGPGPAWRNERLGHVFQLFRLAEAGLYLEGQAGRFPSRVF